MFIQYALWLPGNQIMSGIVQQVSRPRHNPGSRQRFRIISWIARHNGYLSFHFNLAGVEIVITHHRRINRRRCYSSFQVLRKNLV
jgi:hypothetical protein